MELYDCDIVVLENGWIGCVAGDIICFPERNNWFSLDNYECCKDMYYEEYDIAEVRRIDWNNPEVEGSLEYEVIWKRKYPGDMLQNADVVLLRNEQRCIVSGDYFVSMQTGEQICWANFDKYLHADRDQSEYDVMAVYRKGDLLWNQDMIMKW